MYAVFQIGSKQYRVCIGQIIQVERLNMNVGNQIEFNQVLFIKDNDYFQVGSPLIKNGIVVANILSHDFGQKLRIIKFHRRKHFRKSIGHRQYFTKIKVIDIIM